MVKRISTISSQNISKIQPPSGHLPWEARSVCLVRSAWPSNMDSSHHIIIYVHTCMHAQTAVPGVGGGGISCMHRQQSLGGGGGISCMHSSPGGIFYAFRKRREEPTEVATQHMQE